MMERLLTYLGSQSPRTLLLAMAGFLLLLSAQGWLLVRQPLHDYLKTRHDRAAMERRAHAPAATPAEIARVERGLAAQQKRLAEANGPVPTGGTIAQVVAKLSAIARRHGVTLQTVKPAGAKHVREFDEAAFEVEVSGAYRALVASMEQVDRELKPLVITQFSIKRGAAGSMPRLQLRLAAYRLSESREAAK